MSSYFSIRRNRPQPGASAVVNSSSTIEANATALSAATPGSSLMEEGVTIYGSAGSEDDTMEGAASSSSSSSSSSASSRMLLQSQRSFDWLAANFAEEPQSLPLSRCNSSEHIATFYCPICCENVSLADAYELSGGEGCRGAVLTGAAADVLDPKSKSGAGHKFCVECCRAWLTSRVGEGEISNPCPLQGIDGCAGRASRVDVAALCDATTVSKFERFSKLRGNEGHLFRDCPKCSFMNKGHRFMSPQVHCENPNGCGHVFCFHHGDAHPGQTCAWFAFQARKSQVDSLRLISSSSKPCPMCKSITYKFSGCNHMTCSECERIYKAKTHWCWICGEIIAHGNNIRGDPVSEHYAVTNDDDDPGAGSEADERRRQRRLCAGQQFTNQMAGGDAEAALEFKHWPLKGLYFLSLLYMIKLVFPEIWNWMVLLIAWAAALTVYFCVLQIRVVIRNANNEDAEDTGPFYDGTWRGEILKSFTPGQSPLATAAAFMIFMYSVGYFTIYFLCWLTMVTLLGGIFYGPMLLFLAMSACDCLPRFAQSSTYFSLSSSPPPPPPPPPPPLPRSSSPTHTMAVAEGGGVTNSRAGTAAAEGVLAPTDGNVRSEPSDSTTPMILTLEEQQRRYPLAVSAATTQAATATGTTRDNGTESEGKSEGMPHVVTMDAMEEAVQCAITCEEFIKTLAAVPLDTLPQCVSALTERQRQDIGNLSPSAWAFSNLSKGTIRNGMCGITCVGVTVLYSFIHFLIASATMLLLLVVTIVVGAPRARSRFIANRVNMRNYCCRALGLFAHTLVSFRETPLPLLRACRSLLQLRPDACCSMVNRRIQENFGFPGPDNVIPVFEQATRVIEGALDAWVTLTVEGYEAIADDDDDDDAVAL